MQGGGGQGRSSQATQDTPRGLTRTEGAQLEKGERECGRAQGTGRGSVAMRVDSVGGGGDRGDPG